nr:transglutaminase family protein [Neptunicella marina]
MQITSVSRATSISYGEYSFKSTPKQNWKSQLPAKETLLIKQLCQQFAADIMQAELPVKVKVERLCSRIHQEFKYCLHATDIHTSLTTLFEIRLGVCQDFARVMLAILRTYNVEAHYVSGYLYTGETLSDGTVTQPASHAWVSVNLNDNIWCDIDPTNNCWVDDRYISLARGFDYTDVIPIRGDAHIAVGQFLQVSVTIEHLLTKTG